MQQRKHQWAMKRKAYQFANAKQTIMVGTKENPIVGWVVNIVTNGPLHGVVRYFVDGERVAWIESRTGFKNEQDAEQWVRAVIASLLDGEVSALQLEYVKSMIIKGLSADSVENKQWCLWLIADILGFDLLDIWMEEDEDPPQGKPC